MSVLGERKVKFRAIKIAQQVSDRIDYRPRSNSQYKVCALFLFCCFSVTHTYTCTHIHHVAQFDCSLFLEFSLAWRLPSIEMTLHQKHSCVSQTIDPWHFTLEM